MSGVDEVLVALTRLNALRRTCRSGPQPDELVRLEDRIARHGADRRLAVYGTLAPGECNHHHVAAFGGVWRRGHVRGHRGQRRWPVFTWFPDGPAVPVQLLTTTTPIVWAALDAFEGPEYHRIVVPVEVDGSVEFANLYEAAVPLAPP